MANKRSRVVGTVFVILFVLVVGLALWGYIQYKHIREEGSVMPKFESEWLYVYPNDGWEEVKKRIEDGFVMKYPFLIQFIDRLSKENEVKVGAYKVTPEMSIWDLNKKITRGAQDEMLVRIPSSRFNGRIERMLGDQLLADSADFATLFHDSTYLSKELNIQDSTLYHYILPDSYRMFWTTTPEELSERLVKEYRSFWNDERKKLAEKQGLTPFEVTTLASIVAEESAKADEYPLIAGLYLNRLRRGMLLQADPTVIFAHTRQFGIRRVLNSHLKIDSPYNTYKYVGLPPSPIRVPGKAAIEAVLNPADHNYLYMCAKEDFSGRHNYASTYREHLQNARRYINALNERERNKS